MEEINKKQGLENILQSYVEQQNDLQESMLLQRILVLQMSQEDGATSIISYINKLISKNAQLWNGLQLLDKVIEHCPMGILYVNVESWLKACVNISNKEQKTYPAAARFSVLTKILKLSRKTTDYNKLLVGEVPKILNACILIKPTPIISSASLDCLRVCMEIYPTTCGPYRNNIESYLLKYLTLEFHSSIIKKAGLAFNALQQIGGSGLEGITYKTYWTNNFKKLYVTLYKQYDNFLPKLMDLESLDDLEHVTPYDFPELLEVEWNNSSKLHKQVVTLKNIVIFIDALLLAGFPVAKCFSISPLLSVIKKGLIANVLDTRNKSFNDEKLQAAINIHQVHLLYLLNSLIIRFGQHMFMLEPNVTKLLLDCLQHAQKHNFENSEYQKAVYEVFTEWICSCKNIINRTAHKKLLLLILKDITPPKQKVQLRLNKNTKTSEKEKEVTEILPQLSETAYVEALKCGAALLRHVIILDVDNLIKTLIDTLVDISTNIKFKDANHIFNKEEPQKHFYNMLISILTQPTFSCRSDVIQTIAAILKKGKENSKYPSVREVCFSGSELLLKICHPLCPTLNINQNVEDDYHLSNKKRKKRVLDVDESDELSTNSRNIDTTLLSSSNCKPEINNGFSRSPNEKVNIISIEVIKMADHTENVEKNTNMETENDTSHIEEQILEMNIDDDEDVVEEIGTEKASLQDASIISATVEEAVCGLENKIDEKPDDSSSPARTKEDDTEDELSKMLGSFQDVVNDQI